MTYWSDSSEGVNLTEAALREAFDRSLTELPSVCGVTYPHALYPQQVARQGWHLCGTCGQPVLVEKPPELQP